MKIDYDFGCLLEQVRNKPGDMTAYAGRQAALAAEKLKTMPPYSCPVHCNSCCHGSILMSYVEYVHILSRLVTWEEEPLHRLFRERMGRLSDDGKLLCPFLLAENPVKHCAVYGERPLICRVFGTTAAPCPEDIEYPHFSEQLFCQAYELLYYGEDGGFIGLPLPGGLVLFKAPFALWVLADAGRGEDLLSLTKKHGAMHALFYDSAEDRFFTIKEGRRLYPDQN